MSWFVLIVAGLFEALWLIAIEKSESFSKPGFVVLAIVSMTISLLLFAFSVKHIPVTVAYLVWLAVGVCAITAFNGLVQGLSISASQGGFLCLILIGITGLKITTGGG